MEKTLTRINYLLLAALIAFMGLSSCQRENVTPDETGAVLQSGTIAVISSTSTDETVFVVNTCPRGGRLDSLTFSALPAAVGSYLTANYPGYTVLKTFKALTKAGATESYVVVIQFNGKPVGLKFDTSGAFVKIFEQREGKDLKNKGWHPGGRFDSRDGKCRDTITLTALPAVVKTYLVTNYATDTLLHASVNKDGSYVVISKNKGLYATIFSSAAVFIQRSAIPAPPGRPEPATLASLPAAAQSYLTTTYAGYVFNKAFLIKSGTTVKGYVALIDASGTKYSVIFDATGAFVKAITIR